MTECAYGGKGEGGKAVNSMECSCETCPHDT